jgi:hypothetical protein
MGARGPKPGTVPKPKNAGRKKGTPNKRTWALVEILEREGFDPAAKLLQLTLDHEEDYHAQRRNESGPAYAAIASRNCVELMRFVYPQRKAVDVTSGGEKIHISFSDFVRDVVAKDNEKNRNKP